MLAVCAIAKHIILENAVACAKSPSMEGHACDWLIAAIFIIGVDLLIFYPCLVKTV